VTGSRPGNLRRTTQKGLNGFDFGRLSHEKRAEDPGLSR
jgi:hypothetical protein